jgi:2-deoxy-D-gluconate 3-dehydrogenase
MDLFTLEGRVAVVTGGNGGIGLGMARGLAMAGASVVVAARDANKNEAAVQELRALSVNAMAVKTDVRKSDSCQFLFEEVTKSLGGVDILVNNAGMNIRRQPQEYDLESWNTVLETNLTSAMLCSKFAHPIMIERGGGKIINIGSMMSIFGAPFAAAYAASKGGMVQFTKACASAWASDNIQVNAVLPGWIDTDLTRRGRKEVSGLHEKVLARTPAGRWGDPDDHAGVAIFLSGKGSDFVTGAAITVDGGFSIQA